MCIDCARRFFCRLGLVSSTCPPAGRWSVCVIDHSDHVHVRMDEVSGATEWVQVSATREDLLQMLDELGIPYVIRLHGNSSAGCSESIINALLQETVSTTGADTADADTCAVCYDCFNPGDEVVSLPCSHRYHAACINPWLRRATSCPTCRAMVTRKSVGLPEEPPVSESPMLLHTTTSTYSRDSRTTLPVPRERTAIRRLGSWVAQSLPGHPTQANAVDYGGTVPHRGRSLTGRW